MAFTSTITRKEHAGSVRMTMGTFASSSGSTGGNIDTGLNQCQSIMLQHVDSSVVASAPVVNESFADGAVDGSAVTIVTVADTSGIWIAWGK